MDEKETIKQDTIVTPERENFHIQVDTDKYYELMFKMEEMEDVVLDYFPNAEEMEQMEANPKKYLPFVIYLLSQNRETRESVLGQKESSFRKESEQMMQEFIDRHVELIN